jgi:hypothetical protein
MKNHVITTEAILHPEALDMIRDLQEDDNDDIRLTCMDCDELARLLRKERDRLHIDPDKILGFHDKLDHIKEILLAFKSEGGINE